MQVFLAAWPGWDCGDLAGHKSNRVDDEIGSTDRSIGWLVAEQGVEPFERSSNLLFGHNYRCIGFATFHGNHDTSQPNLPVSNPVRSGAFC